MGKTAAAASHYKKVKQYTVEGKHVQTFSSLKDAGLFIGLNPGTITVAYKAFHRTAGSFKWRYK